MNDPRDSRLRDHIKYAYEHAPAVKARFDRAGLTPADIQAVADLVKLPVLPKDDLIALQQSDPPFAGMLGVPMREVSHIFLSPGPIYEPGSKEDEIVVAARSEALQQTGFTADDIVLNTFSYHLVPAGMMLDAALTHLGCTVVPGGVGNSDLQLKMMIDLGVTGYVGTPSFLISLLQKAEDAGTLQSIKISKALVSAEPLFPPQRNLLIDHFGVTIGNAYATAELGILALTLEAGTTMQLFSDPIVEVVDSDTGQPVAAGEAGEVVVTNYSRAYPLIRLGTGDMVINVDPNPGQSKQAERAITLVGRSGDAAKVRGMFVHPNQLRFAAAQVAGISAIQGIVTRPENKDVFKVRVSLAEGTTLDEVREPIMQAVQAACRVRVNILEEGEISADDKGMVDVRDWGGE